MYSLEKGLTFWSPSLGYYADNRSNRTNGVNEKLRCKKDSLSCWFRPLSRCEEINVIEDCVQLEPKQNPSCIPNMPLKVIRSLHRYAVSDGSDSHLPHAYRKLGHLWFVGQLLSYVMRPNDRLKELIAKARSDAGLEGAERPLLSLHVRTGDSCLDHNRSRVCEPLEAYMTRAVVPMANLYVLNY